MAFIKVTLNFGNFGWSDSLKDYPSSKSSYPRPNPFFDETLVNFLGVPDTFTSIFRHLSTSNSKYKVGSDRLVR